MPPAYTLSPLIHLLLHSVISSFCWRQSLCIYDSNKTNMSWSQSCKDSISSKVTSEVCNGSDLGQKVNIIRCTIKNVKKRKLQKNGKNVRHRMIINAPLSDIEVQNATFCEVLKDTCCLSTVECQIWKYLSANKSWCIWMWILQKSKENLQQNIKTWIIKV